ncbi:MAG: arsenite methyltransferase [Anaerolineales bacterium]|nr:arsenite methyltransferase [Chloroflexota bacterium]MBL6980813.1 arsenite methyltransferase [Anaerolineales bacterium]
MTTERTKTENPADIRSAVRERYGSIAEKFQPGQQADCGCGPADSSCCSPDGEVQLDSIAHLYEDSDAFDLPSEVTDLSLGCGDPVTLASLEGGQTVLDLGSGGGIDCFLAAKKVGPTGKVIGVDMTSAMIERARANKDKLGAENVEFRLGEIEHLPVADDTVDVIISNCVINLSPDKPQVFREAFRSLKPGGRLAVSDIVTDGPLPDVIKNSMSAWAGCIAGALDVKEYIAAIQDAGFTDVDLTASYWEQEIIDAAVEQIDPELKVQVEEAKKDGRAVLVVNEGGEGELIKVDGEAFKDFDPQKAIFSAKITAKKPM